MLTKKDKKIKNLEAMVKNRDTFINKQMQTNLKLKQEKDQLKAELDNKKAFINRIISFVEGNKHNNEKVFFSKIKELVTDYQSQN